MTKFTHSRLALPTGVELDVIQSGDPTGVPLLLLHGISDSAPSMRPMMEALPPGVWAIAVTQRGHGDSSKPEGPYTTDAMVADAAAVLDKLGVRRAVILGHSMGSMVAQKFAVAHPDRTAGLILEGAFPGLANNAGVEEFYREAIEPLTGPLTPEVAREFQLGTLAKPVPPEFLELVVSEAQKLPAHAWKAILQDQMAEDFVGRLPQIKAPTLLLWGDRDNFVLREHQEVLLNIPGSTLVVFEGTGHDPHWEEPGRVAALVGEFALRHGARAASLEAAQ